MESGRASSPPKWSIWGSGEWLGRRGGGCRMAASRCLRRASSWARAFCFLLILPPETLRPRVSLELLRRRKLKLERRGPFWASPLAGWAAALEGSVEGSGEPSLGGVAMVGGRAASQYERMAGTRACNCGTGKGGVGGRVGLQSVDGQDRTGDRLQQREQTVVFVEIEGVGEVRRYWASEINASGTATSFGYCRDRLRANASSAVGLGFRGGARSVRCSEMGWYGTKERRGRQHTLRGETNGKAGDTARNVDATTLRAVCGTTVRRGRRRRRKTTLQGRRGRDGTPAVPSTSSTLKPASGCVQSTRIQLLYLPCHGCAQSWALPTPWRLHATLPRDLHPSFFAGEITEKPERIAAAGTAPPVFAHGATVSSPCHPPSQPAPWIYLIGPSLKLYLECHFYTIDRDMSSFAPADLVNPSLMPDLFL